MWASTPPAIFAVRSRGAHQETVVEHPFRLLEQQVPRLVRRDARERGERRLSEHEVDRVRVSAPARRKVLRDL